jgi:hypothetical protein
MSSEILTDLAAAQADRDAVVTQFTERARESRAANSA